MSTETARLKKKDQIPIVVAATGVNDYSHVSPESPSHHLNFIKECVKSV